MTPSPEVREAIRFAEEYGYRRWPEAAKELNALEAALDRIEAVVKAAEELIHNMGMGTQNYLNRLEEALAALDPTEAPHE